MNANTSIRIWFGKLQSRNVRRRVELWTDEAEHFNGAGKTIRVLTGLAWVVVDKQDLTLKAGQTLKLPAQNSQVVVSGLQNAPVTYEVW